MVLIQEGVRGRPQPCPRLWRGGQLDDPRGEGRRLGLDVRLAAGFDLQAPRAIGGGDDGDPVAERLEQLDADAEGSEQRSDHRGRPRVQRRHVPDEAEHGDPGRAPGRRRDLLAACIGRQAGAGELERRRRQSAADEGPDLAAEPVHPARVRFPAELARVADPRRVDIAPDAWRDRHDLAHDVRLDAGKLAQAARITLGDRPDGVDFLQEIALVSPREAPFRIGDDPAETPLPLGELGEPVALDVVLVEHDTRAGQELADQRKVVSHAEPVDPDDIERAARERLPQGVPDRRRIPLRRHVRNAPEHAQKHDSWHVAAMAKEMDWVEDGVEDRELRDLPRQLGTALGGDLLLGEAEHVDPLDLGKRAQHAKLRYRAKATAVSGGPEEVR